MKKLFTLALIASAFSTSVQAQVAYAGIGGWDCARLTKVAAKSGEVVELATQQWVEGFLTALNIGKKQHRQIGQWTKEDVWREVAAYCTANPDSIPMVEAVTLWEKSLPVE